MNAAVAVGFRKDLTPDLVSALKSGHTRFKITCRVSQKYSNMSIIIMCTTNNHRQSYFTASHDHQYHGSNQCTVVSLYPYGYIIPICKCSIADYVVMLKESETRCCVLLV